MESESYQRDNATGYPEPQKSTNNAGWVAPNGVVANVSGTYKLRILDPDDADAADADSERYNDATGVKAFRFSPSADGAASLVALIFGWSTSAGDLTAVNAAMASVDTDYTTPALKGTAYSNVGILIPGEEGAWTTFGGWSGTTQWIMWDGTTRIKTIAIRSSGADYPNGVVLETIE